MVFFSRRWKRRLKAGAGKEDVGAARFTPQLDNNKKRKKEKMHIQCTSYSARAFTFIFKFKTFTFSIIDY